MMLGDEAMKRLKVWEHGLVPILHDDYVLAVDLTITALTAE